MTEHTYYREPFVRTPEELLDKKLELAQITQDVTFHDRTPFLTVDGAMTKDDYVTNYGVLQEAFDTRLVPEEVQLHSAGSFLELHKAILDFYSRYPTMGRQSNTDPHALAKQEQAKKMHVAIEDRVQCEQRQQLRDVRSVLKGLHTYREFLPWHKQTLPKLSATFTVVSGSTPPAPHPALPIVVYILAIAHYILCREHPPASPSAELSTSALREEALSRLLQQTLFSA